MMTSAKETWSVDKVMDWITIVELLFHLAMTAAMILKNVSKRHYYFYNSTEIDKIDKIYYSNPS